MRDAGRGGRFITVGSVADHVGFPENAAYAASKYGLRGLHETLLAEYRGTGVRLTLVSPGPTDTDDLGRRSIPTTARDSRRRAEMLRPADVADAVLFVATRPPHVLDRLAAPRPDLTSPSPPMRPACSHATQLSLALSGPGPRRRLALGPGQTRAGPVLPCRTAPAGACTCWPSRATRRARSGSAPTGRGSTACRSGAGAWESIRHDTTGHVDLDGLRAGHRLRSARARSGTARWGTAGGSRSTAGTTWRNWTYEQLGPEWQYVIPDGIAVRGDTTVVATADGLQITTDDGEHWTAIGDAVGPPARGPADTALPLLTNEYVRRLAPDRRGWNVTTLRGNQRLRAHGRAGWQVAAAGGGGLPAGQRAS